MNFTPYLHNCNTGDLTGALAGIRQIYLNDGKKAVIYQQLDVPGEYYAGAIHSVKDEKGVQVTMNRKMFDMMRPLLLAQDYVEDFQIYIDQKKTQCEYTLRNASLLDDARLPGYGLRLGRTLDKGT